MKQAVLALGLVCAASTASAQDFYLGGTLDYATPHSGSTWASVGLVGGLSFGSGGPLSYAAQGEFSTPTAGSDRPDAARLRGLASYDFGSFESVGGIGLTQYRDGEMNSGGFNVSLGADFRLGAAPGTVRVELLRDWMDDFGTDVTTTRLGYIFDF